MPASRESNITHVVNSLCEASELYFSENMANTSRHEFPSREVVRELVTRLRGALFPGFFGISEVTPQGLRDQVAASLEWVQRTLTEQIKRGLCSSCGGCMTASDSGGRSVAACETRSVELAHAFIEQLPEIRRLLMTDAWASFNGDPAATGVDEVIYCYPGMTAITHHRMAHALRKLGVPLLPRMISELAHSDTGIDIHPGATIGESFFIDHGTGVVIGETARIGSGVKIYQGVTLGAKSFPKDEKGNPIKGIDRHPIIEDGVTIYAGATILGRIMIGQGAVIGGNAWLTRSVAPGEVVSV